MPGMSDKYGDSMNYNWASLISLHHISSINYKSTMERRGITFLLWCCGMVAGFQTRPTMAPRYAVTVDSPTVLSMAKKMQNKQAELAKKLALAKQQNALKEGVDATSSRGTGRLTDSEIKERNDRLRFEELLKKQTASLNDISSDGYLSKQQEDAEIDAYRKYMTCRKQRTSTHLSI